MLRIGLQLSGGDAWIAGVYYVHNLTRALRNLPAAEQPAIILVPSPETERKHYEEIEDLVELLEPPPPQSQSIVSVGRSVKRISRENRLVILFARPVARVLAWRSNRARLRALREAKLSVLFPCLRSMGPRSGIPWLGWAWDFQHKYYPEFFSKAEQITRDRTFAKLAADSKLIVTSSHDALRDFDRFFPGHHEKIRVLHFAAVPGTGWYDDDPAETLAKYDLPPRYLAFPGQFWVHKNHRVAFEAIGILRNRGIDITLVCTGSTQDYRRPEYFSQLSEYLRTERLEERVRVLGLLPRHEQIQVMRGATAILQPSLFEGWSTVVEDARALGKRIFLSDIAVHREQDPPGAIYFDPGAPWILADAIAAHWNELPPGRAAADEEQARAAQHGRVAEYGRAFLEIVREFATINEAAGHAAPAAPRSTD